MLQEAAKSLPVENSLRLVPVATGYYDSFDDGGTFFYLMAVWDFCRTALCRSSISRRRAAVAGNAS